MQTKRVAFYVRVSTKQQTVDNQIHQLTQYYERALGTPGWENAELAEDEEYGHVFRDVGSGAKDSRPALRALNAAAAQRRVNTVLVVGLDRLARSVRHMANLMHDWDAQGVQLVSLREAVDTRTPAGRAFAYTSAIFAELERGLINERVQTARARAKEQGRHIGRQPIDPQRRRELKDMLRAGVPQREIAARLDVGKGTVSDYAKRLKEAACRTS